MVEADPIGVEQRVGPPQRLDQPLRIVEAERRRPDPAAERVLPLGRVRQRMDLMSRVEQPGRDVLARVTERAGNDVPGHRAPPSCFDRVSAVFISTDSEQPFSPLLRHSAIPAWPPRDGCCRSALQVMDAAASKAFRRAIHGPCREAVIGPTFTSGSWGTHHVSPVTPVHGRPPRSGSALSPGRNPPRQEARRTGLTIDNSRTLLPTRRERRAYYRLRRKGP